MSPKSRGRRPFTVGCGILILAGLVHGLPILQSFGDPQSAQEAEYRNAAKAFGVVIGPIDASAWGGTQVLSLSYFLLSIYVGALNLFVMRVVAESGKLRRITLLNVLLTGLLTAVAIVFEFPPAVVFSGFAFAFFAASLWLQRFATTR